MTQSTVPLSESAISLGIRQRISQIWLWLARLRDKLTFVGKSKERKINLKLVGAVFIVLAVIAIVFVVVLPGLSAPTQVVTQPVASSNSGGIELPFDMKVMGSVSAQVLNVRNAPSEGAAQIGTLWSGDVIAALYRNWSSDWVYVNSVRGDQGWVSAQYLRATESQPFSTLPLHRSLRIAEFYIPLGIFAIGLAIIERLKQDELNDLFWVTLAYLLVFFVRVDPRHVASQHVQIAIAAVLVIKACVSGKFDLTPAYLFTMVVAATISIFNNAGVFVFVEASGAAMIAAITSVGLGYAELLRHKCRWSNLAQVVILSVMIGIFSFTGASPVILTIAILLVSVGLATGAGRLAGRNGSKTLVCPDWISRKTKIGKKNITLLFAPDIAGVALAFMILLSL